MPEQFAIPRSRQLGPDPVELLTAVTLAFWTFLVWSPMIAFPEYEVYGIGLGLLGPVIAVTAHLFAPPRLARSTRLAVTWTVLVAGAVIGGMLVVELPIVAVVIPVFVPLAALCWRFPASAMFVLLILSGASSTLNAYLEPFQTQRLIDVILPGLWAGLAWRLLSQKRQEAYPVWPAVALAGFYILLTFVEAFAAETLMIGLKGFRLSAWLMAIVLLFAYAGWPWETYRRIARGIVVVAFGVGAYAVYRWIVGPSAGEFQQAQRLVGPYNLKGNGEYALFTPFVSRTMLGGWSAEVIPFLLAFALSFKSWLRFPALVGAGLCFAALIGSDVRAAVAAVVLGLVIVVIGYQMSRAYRGLHLGTTAIVVLAMLFGGVYFFTATTGSDKAGKERYEKILNPTEDLSFAGRLRKWSTAIPEIDDHPFGHGIGSAGTVQKTSGKYVTAATFDLEGGFLNVAWTQGWAVMLLFVIAVITLGISLFRRGLQTLDRERAGLAIGAAGSLGAFVVMNAISGFNEGLPSAMPWVIAGLAVAAFSRAPQRPQLGGSGEPASRANPHQGASGTSSSSSSRLTP